MTPEGRQAADLPDIWTVPPDLEVPPMRDGPPAPGRRVRMTSPAYADTTVHHSLYLPTDWTPEGRYPVIIEFAGNGPYFDPQGDTCSGEVEGCRLGYGISGGEGVIWACTPCISEDGASNQRRWWGDVDATVAYCMALVQHLCDAFGGNPDNVFLAGFSRGAIACNFIGLHNDAIAALWKGFICHSHYDGVVPWPYVGSDRDAAAMRLARLNNRPQFISHEGTVDETREYLASALPTGNFRFQVLPYHNHTDAWVLRDIPERTALRSWFRDMTTKSR